MEKNTSIYANIDLMWSSVEEDARAHEPQDVSQIRAAANAHGLRQGSVAQGEFLEFLVRLLHARSVITVGTGAVADIMRLVNGLDGTGQLTAVDSSDAGINAIRAMIAGIEDSTETTLRAVKSPVGVFLPRLNAGDYDLIVVGGDISNYSRSVDQAPRLLRTGGVIVLTDAMSMADSGGEHGIPDPDDHDARTDETRGLIKAIRADERFDCTLAPIGTGMLIARLRS
ncbi:methyltransferase [Bifidobacterium minimum]|uniref:Methyltransferase n=1 Tax=Bifidobacterium minimum TaxID=1693 RepID=A0A087BQC9_9BIFI|nr:O-methyltransferase [Bifidobacterium minimum]KFI73229.1 methyltransferase [Bifidobacterium minimum]